MPSVELPSMSKLRLADDTTDVYAHIRKRWLTACGTRPDDFKDYKHLNSDDKDQLLHMLANIADDDQAGINYLSAYEERDIDDFYVARSVEHVVPQSHSKGTKASNDPLGWIVATQNENSRRSNLPLYLWMDFTSGELVRIALRRTIVRVDGDRHYVPPVDQRARLARKWLFIRATYPGIQPMSNAQKKHFAQIVALARHYPIQDAERRMNEMYRANYNWANPLIEENASIWLTDTEWRNMVMSGGC